MIKNYLILLVILYNLTVIYPVQSNCNLNLCPLSQGYCSNKRCMCYRGYITNNTADDHTYCNYKQKSLKVALLLEGFGLIGFGHFYMGRVANGIYKLILIYLFICFGPQFVIAFMKEESDINVTHYIKLIISISCLGFPLFWHFLDLYYIANNYYTDGSNQPLLDW